MILVPIVDEDDGNKIKLWALYRATQIEAPIRYYDTVRAFGRTINKLQIPDANRPGINKIVKDEKLLETMRSARRAGNAWFRQKHDNAFSPYVKTEYVGAKTLEFQNAAGSSSSRTVNATVDTFVYEDCQLSSIVDRSWLQTIVDGQIQEGNFCAPVDSYFNADPAQMDPSCLANHYLKVDAIEYDIKLTTAVGAVVPILGTAIEGAGCLEKDFSIGCYSSWAASAAVDTAMMFGGVSFTAGLLKQSSLTVKVGEKSAKMVGLATMVEGSAGMTQLAAGDIIGGLAAMSGSGELLLVHRVAAVGGDTYRSLKILEKPAKRGKTCDLSLDMAEKTYAKCGKGPAHRLYGDPGIEGRYEAQWFKDKVAEIEARIGAAIPDDELHIIWEQEKRINAVVAATGKTYTEARHFLEDFGLNLSGLNTNPLHLALIPHGEVDGKKVSAHRIWNGLVQALDDGTLPGNTVREKVDGYLVARYQNVAQDVVDAYYDGVRAIEMAMMPVDSLSLVRALPSKEVLQAGDLTAAQELVNRGAAYGTQSAGASPMGVLAFLSEDAPRVVVVYPRDVKAMVINGSGPVAQQAELAQQLFAESVNDTATFVPNELLVYPKGLRVTAVERGAFMKDTEEWVPLAQAMTMGCFNEKDIVTRVLTTTP
jgi:hypothetical protein